MIRFHTNTRSSLQLGSVIILLLSQLHGRYASSFDGFAIRNEIVEEIELRVQAGDLTSARKLAFECLVSTHVSPCPPEDSTKRSSASAAANLFRQEAYLELVKDAAASDNPNPNLGSDDCTKIESFETIGPLSFGSELAQTEHEKNHGSRVIDKWRECCSFFRPRGPGETPSACEDDTGRFVCCHLSPGLDNHLILPALREPSVTVRLRLEGGIENDITIEQDGDLRPFAVAGVLWPAGYLLGLCLSNPTECGVPEVFDSLQRGNTNAPIAVEIGSGVGFATISLAKALQSTKTCSQPGKSPVVIATDFKDPSLALITSNAQINNVGDLVTAFKANHTDQDSLSDLLNTWSKRGFDLVIGSSLQALFDATETAEAPLWAALDALVSKSNHDATVLLAHVKSENERIKLPIENSLFQIAKRISGDHFGMTTSNGSPSDFEIVVLRRAR